MNQDNVSISVAELRILINRDTVGVGGPTLPTGRSSADARPKKVEEEFMMNASVLRTIVALAAVSMAASGATGADRMMLQEQFGATW